MCRPHVLGIEQTLNRGQVEKRVRSDTTTKRERVRVRYQKYVCNELDLSPFRLPKLLVVLRFSS